MSILRVIIFVSSLVRPYFFYLVLRVLLSIIGVHLPSSRPLPSLSICYSVVSLVLSYYVSLQPHPSRSPVVTLPPVSIFVGHWNSVGFPLLLCSASCASLRAAIPSGRVDKQHFLANLGNFVPNQRALAPTTTHSTLVHVRARATFGSSPGLSSFPFGLCKTLTGSSQSDDASPTERLGPAPALQWISSSSHLTR